MNVVAKFKHPHYNAVKKLRFTPHAENILFSASSDGSVSIWDVNRSASTQPTGQLQIHTKACTGIVFSKNSDKIVCTIGYDSKLMFYDYTANKYGISIKLEKSKEFSLADSLLVQSFMPMGRQSQWAIQKVSFSILI